MPRGYLQGVAGEAYLLPKLGEPYRVKDIGIKKYPCCYAEMHPMDGFIELIDAHNISEDERLPAGGYYRSYDAVAGG